ncbi:MAG: DUF1624 domain-containing protein [Atopobiaceae bacterium]|nr:DUF1624 domain-containing protein [Atopobiaceae bacterium]
MDRNRIEHTADAKPSASGRMAAFDVARGFSVISMVLFHLCYDLRFIYAKDLAFFRPPFQDIWRASISWTFLFIAGCMCSFSRNGLKRASRYLLAALAVYVVTSIAAVDVPISFGIIFCMGSCTLIEYVLQRLGLSPQTRLAACVLFLVFLMLRGVPSGYVGLSSAPLRLPQWLYSTPYLSFLGFPGPGFASGDYYPIIPFLFMYLTGVSMGRYWKSSGYPEWFYSLRCAPFEWVGQHALPVYIIHQPLIIGMLTVLSL